jgi:enamine deaminase RidA (YjgF/YER057c/UK114 family)
MSGQRKTAIVTGASQGIGAGIVRGFVERGTTAEDRLAELGIDLPDAPTPFGAYVPAVLTGNHLFRSGMLATSGHTATVVGVVGKDLDVELEVILEVRPEGE